MATGTIPVPLAPLLPHRLKIFSFPVKPYRIIGENIDRASLLSAMHVS